MTADNPRLDVRPDGSGYMAQVPRLADSPFSQSHGMIGQAAMARLQETARKQSLPLEQVVADYLQEMQ